MQLVVKLPSEPGNEREWAIIEMQGDLESRFGSHVNFEGKFIGDLVSKGVKFNQTFILWSFV